MLNQHTLNTPFLVESQDDFPVEESKENDPISINILGSHIQKMAVARLFEIKKKLFKDNMGNTRTSTGALVDESEYFDQYAAPIRKLSILTYCLGATTLLAGVGFFSATVPNNNFSGLDKNDNMMLGGTFIGMAALIFAISCFITFSSKCTANILKHAPSKSIFLPDNFDLAELNELLNYADLEEVKAISNTNDLGKLFRIIDEAIRLLNLNYQFEKGKILRSVLQKRGFFANGQQLILEYCTDDKTVEELMTLS